MNDDNGNAYPGTSVFGFCCVDPNKVNIADYPVFDFCWKWFLLISGLWFAASAWWTLDKYFHQTMVSRRRRRQVAFAFQLFVVASPIYASFEHVSDVALLFYDAEQQEASVFSNIRFLTQSVTGSPIMECWKPAFAVPSNLDCNSPGMLGWSLLFLAEGALGLLTHIGTMWCIVHQTARSSRDKQIANLLLVVVLLPLLWNACLTNGELLEWYISHGLVHIFHHCISVGWFHNYIFTQDFKKSA